MDSWTELNASCSWPVGTRESQAQAQAGPAPEAMPAMDAATFPSQAQPSCIDMYSTENISKLLPPPAREDSPVPSAMEVLSQALIQTMPLDGSLIGTQTLRTQTLPLEISCPLAPPPQRQLPKAAAVPKQALKPAPWPAPYQPASQVAKQPASQVTKQEPEAEGCMYFDLTKLVSPAGTAQAKAAQKEHDIGQTAEKTGQGDGQQQGQQQGQQRGRSCTPKPLTEASSGPTPALPDHPVGPPVSYGPQPGALVTEQPAAVPERPKPLDYRVAMIGMPYCGVRPYKVRI